MRTSTSHHAEYGHGVRAKLVERLGERREEIEQAILTRAHAVSDPTELGDPAYVAGLRAAVAAALDYALAGIEAGSSEPAPIPAELFAQARYAARSGVSLDTVLRRYFAGHTLLGDFVMQEAEQEGPFGLEGLQRLTRTQAALFDRLVAAITEEHTRAAKGRLPTSEQRRVERVQRLLAGELLDAAEIEYDLDAWHLGAIALGLDVRQELRETAQALDRRLLLLEMGDGRTWAWFSGSRRFDCADRLSSELADWPADHPLALGEPGRGLAGWRLTHQQAAAALPIAMRSTHGITRYADVSLLASALQDEVLVRSLNNLYLLPLAEGRDSGETLRETLRAYFAAEGNISSAAAALGISRQTVANRLKAVELRIGRGINTCAAELRAALSLERLGAKL